MKTIKFLDKNIQVNPDDFWFGSGLLDTYQKHE